MFLKQRLGNIAEADLHQFSERYKNIRDFLISNFKKLNHCSFVDFSAFFTSCAGFGAAAGFGAGFGAGAGSGVGVVLD
jgi:hypothetical protein